MFHFTAQSFARTDGFVKSMGKQTRKSDIGAGVSIDESERDAFNDQPARRNSLGVRARGSADAVLNWRAKLVKVRTRLVMRTTTTQNEALMTQQSKPSR